MAERQVLGLHHESQQRRYLTVWQRHPDWPPGVLHIQGGPSVTDCRLLCRIRVPCPATHQVESMLKRIFIAWLTTGSILCRCSAVCANRQAVANALCKCQVDKQQHASHADMEWHSEWNGRQSQRTVGIARGTLMPAGLILKSVSSSTLLLPAVHACQSVRLNGGAALPAQHDASDCLMSDSTPDCRSLIMCSAWQAQPGTSDRTRLASGPLF